jgi:hypothetical protein
MLQSSSQPTTQLSQQQLPNPQPSLHTPPPAQKIIKTVTKTVVQSPPTAAK